VLSSLKSIRAYLYASVHIVLVTIVQIVVHDRRSGEERGEKKGEFASPWLIEANINSGSVSNFRSP